MSKFGGLRVDRQPRHFKLSIISNSYDGRDKVLLDELLPVKCETKIKSTS